MTTAQIDRVTQDVVTMLTDAGLPIERIEIVRDPPAPVIVSPRQRRRRRRAAPDPVPGQAMLFNEPAGAE